MQDLEIDYIINLEDKLCSPEVKTLNTDTKIFKKLYISTNEPIKSTLKYANVSIRHYILCHAQNTLNHL